MCIGEINTSRVWDKMQIKFIKKKTRLICFIAGLIKVWGNEREEGAETRSGIKKSNSVLMVSIPQLTDNGYILILYRSPEGCTCSLPLMDLKALGCCKLWLLGVSTIFPLEAVFKCTLREKCRESECTKCVCDSVHNADTGTPLLTSSRPL